MAENHFRLEVLDQNRFIKENELKPVTNPVMFNSSNGATPDGLLSNDIFGITQVERSGIFSYIDLTADFIQPYYYKIWLKLDRNLRSCIYETQTFKINDKGYLEVDPNGDTGIEFLKKNLSKLNFKDSKKSEFLKALHDGKQKGNFFTNKFIVIPPYYRDANTNGRSGKVGVGEINKLYITLMNYVRALSEASGYGLDLAGGIKGKIQDVMLEIYNWFTIGESVVGGEHTGAGIFKKFGINRRSVMAKTTDYSARLVLSAPKINANSQKDLMVDLDYSSIPLAAALVIAYPFVIYELRQYFNNEFGGKMKYNSVTPEGDLVQLTLKNPLVEFSDDRFDKELNEYIHGYSNRIKRLLIPNEEGFEVAFRFKGYRITAEEYAAGKRESTTIVERDMTWLDILYMAACAATEDKTAIISRYPIDSYFNQLYTKIHVASTIKTEPMVVNDKFYPWYPQIRQEDIGGETSSMFIDTLSMANPYCILMLADYDGDTVTCKMAYTVEANQELQKYMNSPAQFIDLSGRNGRTADKEGFQAMYNLTLVLPEDVPKLSEVEM